MILAFFMSLPRWLRWAIPVALIVAVLVLVAALWPEDDTAQQQAAQTTRSAEAITSAASEAIAIIGENTASEKTIDAAVAEAKEDIANAPDANAVRAAVIASLCRQPSHAADPACRAHDRDGVQ